MAHSEESLVQIDSNTVKLTHLDKIYWPQEGYTKKVLIDYYRDIAPIILPYLKNRPESLHRFPNGIGQPGFFQKNAVNVPEWVVTEKVTSESHGIINYILCQNEATLVYLINLGCIELNPWLSSTKALQNPSFCVLDLDPEKIDFKSVVTTAQAIHAVLESLNIASYCKTSGATGLHIYIPFNAQYSYTQSVQFAKIIAAIVHQKLPGITSLVRSPAKRQGKVYIDCLQNHLGQTLAAPYCARPRPLAPVSTPLEWNEVTNKLDPTKFTIKTIFQRLEKKEDIFKPVLGKGIGLDKVLASLSANSLSQK